MITLFTIGFTKKSAEHFFELLKKYHVKKIIDIRINNTSQLAGFAKGVDLSYFAKQINEKEEKMKADSITSPIRKQGFRASMTVKW